MKNCYINNGTLNSDYKSRERKLFQGILGIFIPGIIILTIGKALNIGKLSKNYEFRTNNYK